uniref:Uncharacterized protein LOC111137839 isoform X3 n=1 Tax=Crassostrea virginica TaxID=6565 RepID=A0A8B8EZ82_CRAVI|nr:uncharacterized protein LOC111137839 isoform X3 [Crassostrea virginica]
MKTRVSRLMNCFTNDSGICEWNKDGIKCCVDFKKNGNKCEGCIGYYGHGCVHKCDPGYYGFGCREKCNCVPCYNVNGSCLDIETTLTVQSAQGVPVWPFIVLGSFGFLTIAAVLTVVVMDSRKLPPSRPYELQHISTDTVSMEYASVENNIYLECNLTDNEEILKDNPKCNHLEEYKTSQTGSGHYLSVNLKPNSSADVWKSIEETAKRNREKKDMLQLLTRRNVPQNTNERFSYVSFVEELSSCNEHFD